LGRGGASVGTPGGEKISQIIGPCKAPREQKKPSCPTNLFEPAYFVVTQHLLLSPLEKRREQKTRAAPSTSITALKGKELPKPVHCVNAARFENGGKP